MSYLDGLFNLTLKLAGATIGITRIVNFASGFKVTPSSPGPGIDVSNSDTPTFLPINCGANNATPPAAPASGIKTYVDLADMRPKAIDSNGILMPLDGGWLTFLGWTPVVSTYTAHPCELVLTDTSVGSPTITLPDATKCAGKRIRIIDWSGNSGTHNVIIASTGGQTISGGAPSGFNISSSRHGLTVISDSLNWHADSVF